MAAIGNGVADIWNKPWMARRVGVWALLAVMVFLLLPEELWARRGGRVSFGRSSSFSRSSSRGSASRAKTWGNSRRNTVTPRTGSRSASRPATSRSYGVDQTVMNRARTQGTVFQSRNDAQRAFERDNANRFPSTFSREPATRPGYIPSTTTVDGRNYDVGYNPRYGGYGYMQNGSWVGYNALRDVAILSLLMRQNNYVYPQSGRTASDGDAASGEDAEDRSGGGGLLGWFAGSGSGLLILLLIIGAWAMIPRRRGAQRYYQGGPPPYTPSGRSSGGGWPPPDAPPSLQPSAKREQSMSSTFDLRSARFWRALRPGSTVILKDEQTLEDMISGGEGLATGRDYSLEEVWRIRESRDIAEWQFFRIRSPHDEDATWLLIKSAGDDISAGVYFEADGFDAGNREDLLRQELYWVFEEPRDPDNYKVLDLHFAPHLYFNVDLNGEAREAEFAKMGGMEFHGKATADPEIGGASFAESSQMIGTVAEYLTTMPVPNPKVVFFEAGVPNEKGGLIRMLQGADIPIGDIEVLALGESGPRSTGR
ncbi:MAG: hypothetical protein U5J83_18520 [Bryobacterales bacterium]|nr:hypothetical protein [Bryobacterales bacterium]